MAAPPLDVDWDAVRAHALQHGVRPAARHFGLNEDSTCARSAREQWFAPARNIVSNPTQLLPITQRPIASNASKPSVAAKTALSALGDKSKLAIAKAVHKGAKAAAKLDGGAILSKSDKLKALADTGDKIHQWSGQPTVSTLRLELVAASVGSSEPAELPAIDVESEVMPGAGEEASPSNDGTSSIP